MAYPLMMYRDGVNLEDHCVVANEQEQAEAEKDGFALLDMAAVKSGPAVPPAEPVKRGPGRPRKA